MKSALVDEIAVRALAVLLQALSMIRGEHDQRLLQKLTTAEELQEIPKNPIHVGQLSVVTRLTAAQARVLWEIVGCVEVVQMEEQKEWRT